MGGLRRDRRGCPRSRPTGPRTDRGRPDTKSWRDGAASVTASAVIVAIRWRHRDAPLPLRGGQQPESLRAALRAHYPKIRLVPQPEPEKLHAIEQFVHSGNFKSTHAAIRALTRFDDFSPSEVASLVAAVERGRGGDDRAAHRRRDAFPDCPMARPDPDRVGAPHRAATRPLGGAGGGRDIAPKRSST
jgi:hypothetical protein